MTKFNVWYNSTAISFQFNDKFNFDSKKYTWVFFMRDFTCNNKYYITYDSSRMKSTYYNLLKNDLYVNEYSYVDVYLKENNDQFVGINGNLNELKDHVRVKGTDTTTSEEFAYKFDQITNN